MIENMKKKEEENCIVSVCVRFSFHILIFSRVFIDGLLKTNHQQFFLSFTSVTGDVHRIFLSFV